VKVLDFGVAKFLRETTDGNITSNNASIGTPRYMAPEQIRSGGTVDFRADIYAVGGILYAMLSGGQLPIEGSTVEEIWQRKLAQDPRPLRELRSDLSADLEKLVLKCLSRDPSKRPASAEDLKKQLIALLEVCRTTGENLQLMKAPSQTALMERRVPGRQLTIGIVVGLITAAAIAIGGISFLRYSPRPAPHRPPSPIVVITDPPTTPPVRQTTSKSKPSLVLATPSGLTPPPTPQEPPPPPTTVHRANTTRQKKQTVTAIAPPPPYPLEPQPILSTTESSQNEVKANAAIARASTAFSNGKLDTSRNAAKQAIELATFTSPETQIRAYLILAKVQLAAGETTMAAKTFDRILAIDPQNPIAIKGKEIAANRSRP
jgi:serine/threonine protein kinase